MAVTNLDAHPDHAIPKLKVYSKLFLLALSFVCVAFGQPAWSWQSGLIASMIGYALFWRVLLCYPLPKNRFYLGTLWFTAVQFVQLSWAISHPYNYIYGVYLFYSLGVGVQFGLLSLLITPTRIRKISNVLIVASIWTILEWARLFFLSGFSWNPVGLAMTGSIYPLQLASVVGIFGLSFWVIMTNALALNAWRWGFPLNRTLSWLLACLIPFIFGFVHYTYHNYHLNKEGRDPLKVVLVQTAFPIEEIINFKTKEEMIQFVLGEWKQILTIIKQHDGKKIDLIALPEFVVPFGTYSFVYPQRDVAAAFKEIFGPQSVKFLPRPESPLAYNHESTYGIYTYVNNAYWAQGIANYFNSALVCGLEDCEDKEKREYYSSAIYFKGQEKTYTPSRYEKRVLVPMGEYIPFSFCQKLCESYGIAGSFTPGKEPKIWSAGSVPFGVSICYEETFGHIMRENKLNGAQMLLNLTSDAWYPNSRLPQQHFDHAKLRTVEAGIPLVRACNTGITGAIDSLGRNLTCLGENCENFEIISDSLYLEVPTYHYQTVYASFGDWIIICLSLLFAPFAFLKPKQD